MNKILMAISSFFIWLTGNVFAVPAGMMPTQILYGPYNEPSLLEKIMNILKIIAIPFIIILGIVIFIIRKKRKNKNNTNSNEK